MKDSKRPAVPTSKGSEAAEPPLSKMEQWSTLVHKIVQDKFKPFWVAGAHGRGVSYQDLAQQGMIGLQAAIDRFDGDHASGARFQTFAWFCIYAEIANYIDQNKTPITTSRWRAVKKGSDSLQRQYACAVRCKLFTEMGYETSQSSPREHASFADLIPDPNSEFEAKVDRADLIATAMRRLRAEMGDKAVDTMLAYHSGKTYTEIGAADGACYETARRLVKQLQETARITLDDMKEDFHAM